MSVITDIRKRKWKTEVTQNIFIFLFFVLISVFFWFLFVLSHKHIIEVTMNAEYVGMPSSKIVTSRLPNEIQVGIKDVGFNEFANFYIGNEPMTVKIDLSGHFDNDDSRLKIGEEELQKRVSAVLPQTAEIVHIYPREIEGRYETRYMKRVRVKPNVEIRPASQYILKDRMRINPEFVVVYGRKKDLDEISELRTERLELNGLSESTRRRLVVKHGEAVSVSPSCITVSADVEQFTEKRVEVTIKGINVPVGKEMKLFPSEAVVAFNVGLSQYNKIVAEDFEVVADYAESEGNRIRLRIASQNVKASAVRLEQNMAEYIISE